MTWESSNRRESLPPDWQLRVKAVWKRAKGVCEYSSLGIRCTRKGRDVDHWEDRGNHGIEALRLLCGFHHDKKTREESIEGMRRKKASVKRPPERHPGLRRKK